MWLVDFECGGFCVFVVLDVVVFWVFDEIYGVGDLLFDYVVD